MELAPSSPARASEPPGGLLVWLIVVLELGTFAIGLVIFTHLASQQPDVFRHGRVTLHQGLALANTLLLLTGGWCMANSLTRLRAGNSPAAARWIAAALASALGFLGLKSVEYADKLSHGFDLRADAFFTLYWLLTGFHFLHVAAAGVLLALMWRGVRRGRYTAHDHEDVASSGIFWHLCDLIWLLLYPAIYLLG